MNNTDNFDSIIFDVDGTLWDIRKIAALAWADVIKEETDWPVRFDDETLGALFGRTMDDIFFHFSVIPPYQIFLLFLLKRPFSKTIMQNPPGR